DRDAEFLDVTAQIAVAPAVAACAAPQRAFSGHTIAWPQMPHRWADRFNDAGKFVAEANWIAMGRRIGAHIERNIRGADADHPNADEDLRTNRPLARHRPSQHAAITSKDEPVTAPTALQHHPLRTDRRHVPSTVMQCRAT